MMAAAQNGLRRRRKPQFAEGPAREPVNGLPVVVRSPSRPRAHAHLAPFNRADAAAVVVLFALAAVSRFYRLGVPGYFDIHPPLGKLVLAYFGYALGYRPDPSFIIKKIGDAYPPSVNYLALRRVSAIFSVLTVPTTYLVSRMLMFSRVASFFTSFQVLTSFLGTIEGRLILMDSQLFLFCQLTLLSALCLWRTKRGTRARTALLATTGVAGGLALGIKHTALATPALVAIVSFFGIHFLQDPLALSECAFAGSIAIVTYALPFYPLLTRVWSTGDKYDKFMKGLPDFQKTLIGHDSHDPTARRPSFLRMFLYLNYKMVASNANVKKRHTWESLWYQWIVNWRGVLYYSERGATSEELIAGTRSIIYLIGNPVIVYLCLFCVALFIMALLITLRNRFALRHAKGGTFMHSVYTGVFLLSGWVCNLAPYVLVDRASFLYHYLPGLFYGQLLSGVILDMLPGRVRVCVAGTLALGMAWAVYYWFAWIYCFPLSSADRIRMQWLPKWN